MAGRRRVVVGPLAEFVEGFLVELVELGYSPRSFEAQVRLLRRLSEWLAVNDMSAGDLRRLALDRFIAERRRTRPKMRSERALAPLLGYLRRLQVRCF